MGVFPVKRVDGGRRPLCQGVDGGRRQVDCIPCTTKVFTNYLGIFSILLSTKMQHAICPDKWWVYKQQLCSLLHFWRDTSVQKNEIDLCKYEQCAMYKYALLLRETAGCIMHEQRLHCQCVQRSIINVSFDITVCHISIPTLNYYGQPKVCMASYLVFTPLPHNSHQRPPHFLSHHKTLWPRFVATIFLSQVCAECIFYSLYNSSISLLATLWQIMITGLLQCF